jgi:hypothetical protein
LIIKEKHGHKESRKNNGALFKKYKGAMILGIDILIEITKAKLIEIIRAFYRIYKAKMKINDLI